MHVSNTCIYLCVCVSYRMIHIVIYVKLVVFDLAILWRKINVNLPDKKKMESNSSSRSNCLIKRALSLNLVDFY